MGANESYVSRTWLLLIKSKFSPSEDKRVPVYFSNRHNFLLYWIETCSNCIIYWLSTNIKSYLATEILWLREKMIPNEIYDSKYNYNEVNNNCIIQIIIIIHLRLIIHFSSFIQCLFLLVMSLSSYTLSTNTNTRNMLSIYMPDAVFRACVVIEGEFFVIFLHFIRSCECINEHVR